MFTGIVEDLGTIAHVSPRGNGLELAIRTRIPLAEVKIGDSIATDGVCLTAERCVDSLFYATAAAETLASSTLGDARIGRVVHLERAMQLGGRLDGHLVQGHVDGVGKVRSARQERETWVFWIDAPREISRYIAGKGSICIDGVSLTVNEVDGAAFRVNVVPHTAQVTRFATFTAGQRVNLEVDVIAKYVERLLGTPNSGGLTLDTLQKYGFTS